MIDLQEIFARQVDSQLFMPTCRRVINTAALIREDDRQLDSTIQTCPLVSIQLVPFGA